MVDTPVKCVTCGQLFILKISNSESEVAKECGQCISKRSNPPVPFQDSHLRRLLQKDRVPDGFITEKPFKKRGNEVAEIYRRDHSKLVASRDLAEGEVILIERPLLGAPVDKTFLIREKKSFVQAQHHPFRPICLTCCRNVVNEYSCIHCGFPMCGQTCQQHPDHADYECRIFTANRRRLSYFMSPAEYRKVRVLRCLLLREKNPSKWDMVMGLDPHDEIRNQNSCAGAAVIAISHFIREECGLVQYDVDTISRVLGIVSVHSLNTWNPWVFPLSQQQDDGITKASFIFYNASLIRHDCISNSRCIIQQSGIGIENFQLTVVASRDIPKGQAITNCYVDITLGTLQRRLELQESSYVFCTCQRCMDPTEMGTYLSALKCPKCTIGHLLPGNPLSTDPLSLWLCNNSCDFFLSTGQVITFIRSVRLDIETVVSSSYGLWSEYYGLQGLMSKYKGTLLHPHHFLIMNTQYAILAIINQLLGLTQDGDTLVRLSLQTIEYCSVMMENIVKVRPGNNRILGNICYFYQEGLLLTFLAEAKDKMEGNDSVKASFQIQGKYQFNEILDIMRRCVECLILEPPGNPEYTRATKVKDSVQSNLLQFFIKYFNLNIKPFPNPLPKS